jgi:hypothetical protein
MRWLLVVGLAGGIGAAATACAQGSAAEDVIVRPDGSAGLDGGDEPQDGSFEPVLDAGAKDTGASKDGGAKDTGSGPCTPRVVINELQTSDKFVELYNDADCEQALEGYTLMYSSAAGSNPATMASFTKSHTIGARGYLVIGSTTFNASTKDVTFTIGALGASGGRVGLLDKTDKVVDSVGYGDITGGNSPYVEGSKADAPASGKSLARKPNGQDSGNNKNDFSESNPTPRAAN